MKQRVPGIYTQIQNVTKPRWLPWMKSTVSGETLALCSEKDRNKRLNAINKKWKTRKEVSVQRCEKWVKLLRNTVQIRKGPKRVTWGTTIFHGRLRQRFLRSWLRGTVWKVWELRASGVKRARGCTKDALEIKGDKAFCIIKVKLRFQELKYRDIRRKGKNLKMGELGTKYLE